MNLKRNALTLLGVLLVGAALAAQSAPPASAAQGKTQKREAHIAQREANQQKRIAQGAQSGQLTPRETARLERQQAKISKDVAKAEADGKVTRKEAAKIQQEQNRASRNITRQKHDRQKAH